MKTIVFDDTTRNFVLSIFKKTIDDEGYIIEQATQKRVLTPSGDEVKATDFAGLTPGSEIILTEDLPSLLQYVNTEG